MIAVIFEVWPDGDHRQDYFDIAASLKPELERIDGFISVERFSSLTEEGKILSLSFWRDEDAVKRWRTHSNTAQRNVRAAAASSATIVCALHPCFATTACSSANKSRKTRNSPQHRP